MAKSGLMDDKAVRIWDIKKGCVMAHGATVKLGE
jgi:hypothetical protein